MEKRMRVSLPPRRSLLIVLPLVALLSSCSSPGAGGQKMDAATIKKIDDIAAKERAETGSPKSMTEQGR